MLIASIQLTMKETSFCKFLYEYYALIFNLALLFRAKLNKYIRIGKYIMKMTTMNSTFNYLA
ncbi:MAG: hypothetical protein COA59_14660 [Colwellia sp.]|nr:MAG: hypothetical protein COA59_14660 [Colwellia sp.]